MRWATYLIGGTHRVGLVLDGEIRGIAGVSRLIDLLGDDGELMERAAEQARRDPSEVIPVNSVQLAAPIPVPPSFRDFMAFEEHVINTRKRTGAAVDAGWYDAPVFYFSNPAAIHPPRGEVAIPPGCRWFDYELEVAAVIGRGGSDLHPDTAEQHIAGYLVLADWSARDLQRQEMPLRFGPVKGKDSATSIGPWLVTPDELEPYRSGRSYNLAMTATVNGRLYSEGNLSTVYWSFGEMLAYASRGTRLVPGDVVGSGTVGRGCILELSILHGEKEYPWLAAGDEVHLQIEALGAIDAHIVPGVAPIPLR